MKFTNAICVVFATTFTVASAAPVIIAARQPLYVARSFHEIDAREPFDWGSAFRAIAPIAKPWVAKIPKVGGFLSSFFKRDDGSLDEELLENYLAKVIARNYEDMTIAARDLDAREPFDWGSAFKALAPIAKPWVAKIPKVGGFLSSFFKRDDGTLDEELLNDFLAAQALSNQRIAARSPQDVANGLVATAILSELAKEADSNVAARGLDAREPFDWGSAFKALAPIAKPWVAKIPKVGGFLSSFFKRDGSLDEELFADFVKASLTRRGEADDDAEAWNELAKILGAQ